MDPLRTDLKQLLHERDAMEQEISAITAKLNGPGMPGVNGSLLDKEVRPF